MNGDKAGMETEVMDVSISPDEVCHHWIVLWLVCSSSSEVPFSFPRVIVGWTTASQQHKGDNRPLLTFTGSILICHLLVYPRVYGSTLPSGNEVYWPHAFADAPTLRDLVFSNQTPSQIWHKRIYISLQLSNPMHLLSSRSKMICGKMEGYLEKKEFFFHGGGFSESLSWRINSSSPSWSWMMFCARFCSMNLNLNWRT